jgi:hypothetical protein
MSIRQLTQFLESINQEDDIDIDQVDEEIDDAKLTQELKDNLLLLKKKHGGNLDIDKFVNNLKKIGAPVGDMQTEEVMVEGVKELWQRVKKSKVVPVALVAAVIAALEESGIELPKDPIELIHYGEVIDSIVHNIAHYGPEAITMISNVMG